MLPVANIPKPIGKGMTCRFDHQMEIGRGIVVESIELEMVQDAEGFQVRHGATRRRHTGDGTIPKMLG